MLFLLVLVIAALSSTAFVCAADLENHDFDGFFSMDVAKGGDFDKSIDDDYTLFTDFNNEIVVTYAECDEKYIDAFWIGFEKEGFKRTGETGDYKFFESDGHDVASYFHDGKIVIVMDVSDDFDVEEMIKTVKFWSIIKII